MMNYNKELNKLFEIWVNSFKEKGIKGFCYDGLMLKGPIFQNDKGDWLRSEGNENELWFNADRRILFLMKEPHGNPGEDIRTWTGRQHPTIISNRYFKNIALWLSGLNSIINDGKYISFDDINIAEYYSKLFDELPLAIVYCNKDSGSSMIDNASLFSHARLFGNFLKNQIEILDPKIIVCGGGMSIVLKIAKEIIFPGLDFIKINEMIHYNKSHDIVLIDSFHPTSRISYEEIYESIMNSYQDHLIKINLVTG